MENPLNQGDTMMKKLKIINIVLFCLSVLCIGLSTYLRSLKEKLPLPKEETQIILKCNEIGLFLKDISIILIAVLFITILLYIIKQKNTNINNSENQIDSDLS